VANSRWRPLNFDYVYLSLQTTAKKFQRLYLCFRVSTSDINEDWTLKARTKDWTLKAKARTKDWTLKAKARTRTGPSRPRPSGPRISLKHAKGLNKDFTFALFKFSKKTDQSSDNN